MSDNNKLNVKTGLPSEVSATSFLPTSVKEMKELGWEELDVVLFSGDAYIDHPSFGTAIIARVLEAEGLRVGIVPQPNWRDDLRDFKKLGTPRLFFAVTAGSMDSMVNHYTAGKRKRSDDAYTPEGRAGQRPDDASIVYCNILKELYPEVPIVLGGVEASLRRFVHYDYWKDAVRPSILEESKADLLSYGMSEEPMREIVHLLQKGVPFSSLTTVPQTALLVDKVPQHKLWEDVMLHSLANNLKDKRIFAQDFRSVEEHGNAFQKKRFQQKQGQKILVVNPAYPPMSTQAIDAIYALPYTRLPHPRYEGKRIPAFDMIQNSVTTHRGCFGGCAFCAIYSHQGKFIASRSKASIMAEVEDITSKAYFKGTISDLGGPSANMYRMAGMDMTQCQKCRRVSCVYPKICKNLDTDHQPITEIYRATSAVEAVKHCYVGSGIRYDMLIDDKGSPLSRDKAQYLTQMITEHTSGRLTVAPEHTSDNVLKLMRKPSYRYFTAFEKVFQRTIEKAGKKFQLVPYFISGHPGSEEEDMAELAVVAKAQKLYLEQVQDFTPTPMSLATTMYYTGINPYTGEEVYTATTPQEKTNQKRFFFWYKKEERAILKEELKKMGRRDLEDKLFGKVVTSEEPKGRAKARDKARPKDKAVGKFHDKPNKFTENAKPKSRFADRSEDKPKFGDRSKGKPRFEDKSHEKPKFSDRSSSRSSDKPSFGGRTKESSKFGDRGKSDAKFGTRSTRSGGFEESSSDKPRFNDRTSRSDDKLSYRDRSKDKPRFEGKADDKPKFGDRSRGKSSDRPKYGDKSKSASSFDDKPRGKSSAGDKAKDKPRFKENTKFKSTGKPKFHANSKVKAKRKGSR